MQLVDRIGEARGGTSGGRTVLVPDGDAPHLEGKLVAHYHAGPLGATKVNSLKFCAPGSSNIRMLLEPIRARPTSW
jgi:hypothetical protein